MTAHKMHASTTPRRHVGEWYDTATPHHASYDDQKAKAVHDIWVTVAAYGAFAAVSGAAICFNRAAGKM